MADKKQVGTASVALLLALSAGHVSGRLSAPQLNTSAHPVMVRWLNDGPGKPPRYAIGIDTRVGANAGSREVVCEADGSGAKLNGGVPAPEFAGECEAVYKMAVVVSKSIAEKADRLVK